MFLHDIMDVTELHRLIAGRYINHIPSPDGRLAILDYTDRTTYDRVWTPETRASRGLIYRLRDGRIIARPFDKFGNVGEGGFPELEPGLLAARPGPLEVTEKLDGTMVVVWWDAELNAWRATTRGDWANVSAKAARRWLDQWAPDDHWPTALTLIGEWCSPHNRVVVPYADSSWRVIGARHTSRGTDINYGELRHIVREIGLGERYLVPRVPFTSLDEVQRAQQLVSDVEGWVVRWPDGFRAKVKTVAYLHLARMRVEFTPRRVLEALLANTWDTYEPSLSEELRDMAAPWVARYHQLVAERLERCRLLLERHRQLLPDRAALVRALQQDSADDWHVALLLLDGKNARAQVVKQLTPAMLTDNT